MATRKAWGKGSQGWDLCLYVVNHSAKSITAFSNLKRFCEEKLTGKYRIEVIDIAKHPEEARNAHIVAIPTLIRRRPLPMRICIGDLSDLQAVLSRLDLCPSPLPIRKREATA